MHDALVITNAASLDGVDGGPARRPSQVLPKRWDWVHWAAYLAFASSFGFACAIVLGVVS